MGPNHYCLFELDVKEMFPRLPRTGVLDAVRNVAAEVVKALEGWGGRCVRMQLSGLKFAIHKCNRQLDRIGPAYSDEYGALSMDEVTRYILFDVQHNDMFTVGGKIFRQKRGLAIWGLCSAQLAELYCIWCECHAYRAGSHNHLWRRLFALPLCPYRFRDNIVGLVRDGVQLSRVQAILEKMYSLELQTEGEGVVLPSLEAQIAVDPESRRIAIQLKDKVVWSEPPAKRIVRFPNPQSAVAQTAVASIPTTYGLKGPWYAASARDVLANAVHIIREFVNKHYPHSWWRSRLVEGLSRGGTVTVQQVDRMVKQALQEPAHTQAPCNALAPTYAQRTCPVMPVGPPAGWLTQPRWEALTPGSSPYHDAMYSTRAPRALCVTEHRKHCVLHAMCIMGNNNTHHVIVFSLHMFFFAY